MPIAGVEADARFSTARLGRRPLPIPLPCAANRHRHRVFDQAQSVRAVGIAAVVFHPFGLVAGIGVSLLFLAWAVPEFRDPNYYQRAEQPEAQQTSDKPSEEQSEHYWIDALRGYVFTEDSLAQWIMAAFGIAATLISLLALYWLKGTWDQARRNADAAWKAVDVTRDIGRAQTRAYLSIGAIHLEKSVRLTDGHALKIKLTNKGNSPAYLQCIETSGSIQWGNDVRRHEIRGDVKQSRVIIAPSSDPELTIEFDDALNAPAPIKEVKVFFTVAIRYRDVFEIERISKVTRWVDVPEAYGRQLRVHADYPDEYT